MSRKMLRYEVPVDDKTHAVALQGEIRHVAGARTGPGSWAGHVVEFWAEGDPAKDGEVRFFCVFGTGHDLPDGAVYRGTSQRTPEGLVWHLYELTGG